MKNVVMIRIKMFGVLNILLIGVLCPGCKSIGQEIKIPQGIYTSQNGNLLLNFKNESQMTMELNNVVMEAWYQLEQNEYSSRIKILLESSKDTLVAQYYIEEDRSIYLMYFKTKEGISHHIDEIGRFYLSGYNGIEPVNCSTIILDSIQTGEYLLHFENTLSINNLSCDTINITKPGLSRVAANLDLRNIEKIQILSNDGQIIDSLPCRSEKAHYQVDILGFNQEGRASIENKLSENIYGDVFMFNINKIPHSNR